MECGQYCYFPKIHHANSKYYDLVTLQFHLKYNACVHLVLSRIVIMDILLGNSELIMTTKRILTRFKYDYYLHTENRPHRPSFRYIDGLDIIDNIPLWNISY